MDHLIKHPTEVPTGDPKLVKQVPGLPDRFFNQEGDLDLRQVSGDEAVKYVRALGWAV